MQRIHPQRVKIAKNSLLQGENAKNSPSKGEKKLKNFKEITITRVILSPFHTKKSQKGKN